MSKKDLFGEKYYKDRIGKGIDYNFYGDWQKNYAKLLISITDVVEQAANDRTALFVDLGTACGVNLRAMKELKVFGRVVGLDISEYLVNLGKQSHGFTEDEIKVFDITDDFLPFDDNEVTMLHCSHTLEHIQEKNLDHIFKEISRVLSPEGIGVIVIPATKPGMPKKDIELGDETHINVQSEQWWRNRLRKIFDIDSSVRDNFKENKFSPSMDKNAPSFYETYSKGWTLFGIRKK